MQGVYPSESKIIIENSYVDDILFSVESPEILVERLKNIDYILSQGSFKIKQWIISGNKEEYTYSEQPHSLNHVLHPHEERVLGMTWVLGSDLFRFNLHVKFDGQIKCSHKETLRETIPSQLSRRMLLSQIAQIYDPFGFLTPYILMEKILMRNMCQAENVNGKINWDNSIDDKTRSEWITFFLGLFDVQLLTFQRCIKTRGAFGEPILIIFSDGSKSGYGCCAYIRWQTSEIK